MSTHTDITSDGGMDPRNDADRLARHRALHNIGLPPHPQVLTMANCQTQLQTAVRHLHALLNSQRTAVQSWEAEKAARDWLESIRKRANRRLSGVRFV